MNTLESSIAERLDSMLRSVSNDSVEFNHYLTIIGNARIREDHGVLSGAVARAAHELGMAQDSRVAHVVEHINAQLMNAVHEPDEGQYRTEGHA